MPTEKEIVNEIKAIDIQIAAKQAEIDAAIRSYNKLIGEQAVLVKSKEAKLNKLGINVKDLMKL